MTEFTDEKLSTMLGKVQALLAVAENPATEPKAAENYRERAESIMAKYRIAEETLRQERVASGTAAKPVEVMFNFVATGSPYRNHYYTMIYAVMNHMGVRGQAEVSQDEEGHRTWAMNLIGFDTDIQLVQMIYTNLRLVFSEKLEPKLDPTLDDSENVYRLRSAGIERGRISKMLWPDKPENSIKVTKLYALACAARGEDPKVVGRSVNAKTFRTSYADAFVSETSRRLRRMKSGSAESGALVLVGREEAVNEAFYERYPHLRPKAELGTPRQSVRQQCEKCQKSKRGACREHYIATGGYRERPYSSAGWSAGTSAAREADLSRAGSAPAPRLGA